MVDITVDEDLATRGARASVVVILPELFQNGSASAAQGLSSNNHAVVFHATEAQYTKTIERVSHLRFFFNLSSPIIRHAW